jgi:hypothetical protein
VTGESVSVPDEVGASPLFVPQAGPKRNNIRTALKNGVISLPRFVSNAVCIYFREIGAKE